MSKIIYKGGSEEKK
ncbi:Protein of unknown function [Bacillus mycoides]|nr:Protein of unknown function [Bacillus mycoides]SCM97517.1 Protein of unknown function [Bacillus mycoides]SCN08714.1 Protein of unknown function [Bacillus wiedmannii]